MMDPMRVILDPNNQKDMSNMSRFLNRLKDESLDDPEATRGLFIEIQNIYGQGKKQKI